MTSQAKKSSPQGEAQTTVIDSNSQIPGRPFPIVAIGASAGGLEALEQFLGHVPAASGMAFIVIQHLDPDHKGMIPELLQRITVMPVTQARNRMKVRPDWVYVIPPNSDLSILHDCLYLLEPVAPRGMRLPIDFFFRALADDRREQAIGVILSGMGADGTLGVRAIKEKGGLVLAQAPLSAKFDSMPRSVIDAGLADIVATAEELPLRIRDTPDHSRQARLVIAQPDSADQRSAFDKTCILLRARTGHDFSLYKKTTVYRRIERRMAIHQIDRIADYVYYLRENPQELNLLFKELLIGVTSFFRDPAIWAYLQDKVIPDLLASHPTGAALRAWVAGCSTGEEAYSLAITFREVQESLPPLGRYSLQIFATDLDADAIDRARQAVYPANIAADISEERLKRFFVENGDGSGYQIAKEIREMVVFAPQNIISDPPFTKLDILTCRNLLIYLGPELQKKLLPLFHYSLKPGGVLMLGSAESIGSFSDLFSPLESRARLFQRSNPLNVIEIEFPTRQFPTKVETLMDAKSESPTANLQRLADHLLLQQFSPAAVLVNASGDLVYISGRTGKYLEPAAGKVNWNIYAMARDGLRQELALALPTALRTGEQVICRNLRVGTNGGTQTIDLMVHPIQEPVALRGMAMLVFTDVVAPPVHAAATGKQTPRAQRELELEKALAQEMEKTHRLRDEMQTTQEEVKSASEELQSTNEELQSANEELSTSKEEMQSLNEELQTVNTELQSKVDELSSANSDLTNLLNSTDMATVFLNNALHVRRFTTQMTRLFKLIPGDVGRPLSDIVTNLAYPELQEHAEDVLRTLVFSNREIATSDGRWFQVKIMPYRTLENVIDGVVITFNDISPAKKLEAQLREVGSEVKA